jgi:hypothetical protein
MKRAIISLLAFLVVNLATTAWAQGLYGAPDALTMQPQPATSAYVGPSAPYAGQPTFAPATYAPQVAPYSAPSGYVAPQQPQYAAPAGYTGQPVANSSSGPAYRTASTPRPTYVAQQPVQPPMTVPAEPIPEPATQSGPGLTNQMLGEHGQAGAAGTDGFTPYDSACGPCRSGVEKYEGAACGDLANCGTSCLWYGSLTGLALTRNEPNQLWVSNEPDPNLDDQTMKTSDAESGWKFGGEIRFGRRFCCCECDPCNGVSAGYWAIEADYWTTDPFVGDSAFRNADGSSFGTPLNVGYINIDIGGGAFAAGDYWFNDSYEQRVWRRNEIHSAEINLVHGQWANLSGSNWDFAFSAGPRFFRFYEDLKYGALKNVIYAGFATPFWGQNGGLDEAYIRDQISNNLWGGQLGVDLGYNFAAGGLRLFVTPKVGIYDNNVTSTYQAYLGNGNQAYSNYNWTPGDVQVPVYTSNTTNSFAVLTQVDTGVEWFFLPRWSARFGYRLVSISGVGLADNQIPPYINDVTAASVINTNGELFIHGGFATLTFNF